MSREDIRLRVRDILTQKGMDCASLAEKMGKSPQYVNNVLNKRKDMSLNALIGIADALGVEFGDLFISSFTPAATGNGALRATVCCGDGVFSASTVDGLRDIADMLSDRNTNMIALSKRTLERYLRFPSGSDNGLVSEMMANLSRCMPPDGWHAYYHATLRRLLPPSFAPDYAHLSAFMDEREVDGFRRSLS